MKRFQPQTFNDMLALVLIFGIIVLWILQGRCLLTLAPEVTGALIVTWTLVVQYYFRKAKTETESKSNKKVVFDADAD
jgi:uncharacterized membrane protein YqiK